MINACFAKHRKLVEMLVFGLIFVMPNLGANIMMLMV